MAKFSPKQFPNRVTSARAWDHITDMLKSGEKSVEVVLRVVDGKDVWEIRTWDDARDDRSNLISADPDTEY